MLPPGQDPQPNRPSSAKHQSLELDRSKATENAQFLDRTLKT
jgi:hypothetical protein